MSHHPMTPLGRTVRLGDLVLGEHGAIDVGGTRLPAGIEIKDCHLGTGADRATLSRTPDGRVILRHRGETLAYAWDPAEGRWYGPSPNPNPEAVPAPGPLHFGPGARVLLAAVAVGTLAWMLPRAGSRTQPTANDAARIGADARGEEPLAEIVDDLETALEYGELGLQEVTLSAEQQERIVDAFAAQARVARALEQEMGPFQTRMIDFAVELGELEGDARLPFALRRRVAQLTAPHLEQTFYDITTGGQGVAPIAQQAEWQAGRVLRREGPFTLADACRALDDQAALEAAFEHVRTHHERLDALLPEIPPRFLEGRVVGEDLEPTFATLFAVDEDAVYEPRSAGELKRLMGRLAQIARTDGHPAADEAATGEARRLIAGFVARHSTLPGRLDRIAGDLARCRREAETLFAPMLADRGVTPR
ncbi:hypothetical protein [Tautonia rosea]|uniref:hypothetical protein n=1 Tax=Tautonia rosea TaxID=2728037 RepID=UPI001472DB5B|nr:hypothetical protein [Tautonia rosea]